MITISQSEDDNFYCPDCVLKFGSIFDAEGNTYCPRCKKLIDKKLDESRESISLPISATIAA